MDHQNLSGPAAAEAAGFLREKRRTRIAPTTPIK
jgi:hypothetical protein